MVDVRVAPRAGDYDRLDEAAAASPAGADGLLVLPVLGDGERTDPDLRGAIVGLSLRHDRGAIARAVLEGVAFAIRDQLDQLREGGIDPTELRVSGGDARLATWNRIKADVTGLPVRTVPGDAAVTGVAMLAGLGAGVYRDVSDAIGRCARPDPAIDPDPGTAAAYDDASGGTGRSRRLPWSGGAAGGGLMRLRLGIDTCFAVKRWPRPEDWAPIVRPARSRPRPAFARPGRPARRAGLGAGDRRAIRRRRHGSSCQHLHRSGGLFLEPPPGS